MALQPTAQQMAQWLEQCKPMIKDKMAQNIDVRVDKLNEVINGSIQAVIYDMKSNNINMSFILSPDTLPIFKMSSALIQSAKKELWSRVDNWSGLGCFRKQQYDFKSYKKNADNWWNRHKAEWIGDHLFHPLFTELMPNHIITIIGVKRDHSISNPIYDALYNLLYFTILYAIFHAEISFARTKFLPLILDQSLCHKKCKYTLQPLFTALGNQHSVPWSNAHTDQGSDARLLSQQWVTQVVKKTQSVYKHIVDHYQNANNTNNNHNEMHSIADMKTDVAPPSIPSIQTNNNMNINNAIEAQDVNNLYLDASGVIVDGYVMDSYIVDHTVNNNHETHLDIFECATSVNDQQSTFDFNESIDPPMPHPFAMDTLLEDMDYDYF